MTNTPALDMSPMSSAQAQKHVIFNEMLYKLDAIIQLAVLDRGLTAPPGSPVEGAIYIPAATATGDWVGQEGKIAQYINAAWEFYTPKEGWIAYIADEDTFQVFNGASWTGCTTQNAPLMGVNTTADSTNKLSVASSAILFNNIGNGIQTKLNKASASDTASFLFQTNWSGRAEIGTCGDDNFSFKVSADGSNWGTGLTLVGFSGVAKAVPKLPSFATSDLPSASSAGAGAMAWDSTLAQLVVSNGSSWVAQT